MCVFGNDIPDPKPAKAPKMKPSPAHPAQAIRVDEATLENRLGDAAEIRRKRGLAVIASKRARDTGPFVTSAGLQGGN